MDDRTKNGWKLLGEHCPGCSAERYEDGLTFVTLDRGQEMDWHRRRNGDRGGSTMWWRFRCNDTDCGAIMLVRWDTLAYFVSNPLEDDLDV